MLKPKKVAPHLMNIFYNLFFEKIQFHWGERNDVSCLILLLNYYYNVK